MAKLIALETLKGSLAQCDTEAAQEMLNAAAEMATIILSGYLRTPFDLASYTDYFDFSQRGRMDQDDLPLYLKPKAGFIKADTPTPTFELATDWDTLASTPVTVDAADYIWDLEKGALKVMKLGAQPGDLFSVPTRGRAWGKITYDAGFATKSDDVGKVYVGVPTWLSEAARLMTVYEYDVLIVAKSSKEQVTSLAEIPISVRVMLDPYVRVFQSAITPL